MIIIPMAGLSSRFFKAGFTQPKYMLMAHGKSLFEWSLKSFENYFSIEKFVFICRDVYDTPAFLKSELEKIGIENFEIVILERETEGQASTVLLGLENIDDNDDLLIFNIDTWRHNFVFDKRDSDGYLEVFAGEGEHWSFVLPGKNEKVLRTTEKERISNLCSNGIYYFKNKKIYLDAYHKLKKDNPKEMYIAPMYNYLIDNGGKVHYTLIDYAAHTFMGTPVEYEQFLREKFYV